MATDPVCEMAVERERAVSAERDGETFVFCSRGCRDEFLGGSARNGGANGREPHSWSRLADALLLHRPVASTGRREVTQQRRTGPANRTAPQATSGWGGPHKKEGERDA